MSVRRTNNVPKILIETEVGVELAIRFALEDIRKTAEPNTPKKTGLLRSSATILATQGVVNWTADHAIYQEKKQYANYTTPGTGPHFAENAVKEVSERFDTHLRAAGVID
jgi:hypothetical protein